VDNPSITYATKPGTTRESEVAALAACYRIIIDCQGKRDRLPDKSGPDDAKQIKNDSRQKHHSR
jgi:hypothetical protein